jgi:glutathione-regulated potassium-efflux system ancillary protein KefG
MARILILFAHPALERSRVHTQLLHAIKELPGLTLQDLYEAYPDLNVNIDREQALLLQHDIILFQHPFYWYSSPAIVKQWQDLVLEHGWAYGRTGTALRGKFMGNVISTGGPQSGYSSEGPHHHTMTQFLAPFRQTANLCNMTYLPPFVIHGTHKLDAPAIARYSQQYRQLLEALRDERFTPAELAEKEYLNNLL